MWISNTNSLMMLFTIEFKDEYILHAFTYDFEKLDDLFTKIFGEVIKTDIETLSVDENVNSNFNL